MKKLTKKEITKLVTELKEIKSKLEKVKPLYDRLDKITIELIGQDISGFGLAVIDNFKDKNCVFRPAAVRRYEIKDAA